MKYGEFVNGYAPSTIEPSQCLNNSDITHTNSLETLTSLEDENVDEHQQSQSFESSAKSILNYPNMSCNITHREEPLNLTHIKCSHLKQFFNNQEFNILERIAETEQCYASRVSFPILMIYKQNFISISVFKDNQI